MKFNNIVIKATLGVALVSGLASCTGDWLDLQPADRIDEDLAIKNSDDLTTARTGMYNAFKGTSSLADYYGRNMFVYGDMRGEDVQYNHASGSGRAQFYYYMTYSTADNFNNTGSTAVWQTPFVLIGRACRILEAQNLSDATEAASTIALYQAEAKVMRAFATFDLTRIYGKPYTEDNGASLGAPIVTTSLESTEKPSRSTVAECYTQVLKDLNEAINSGALPTEATPGYINVWTAKALLSRVYLSMGNNTEVMNIADDFIKNSPYRMWTTDQYAKAWDKSDANHTNEMIFEIAINDNTDWTDRNGIAYLYREANNETSKGYGDVVATKTFVDMLTADPKDVRNDIMLAADGKDEKEAFGTNKVFINKMQPVNADVRYANVPVLRLSEVLLSAAEAAFDANRKDKAAIYLNYIIENRTTDASKKVTENDITSDRIWTERRKELIGEGQRFFDAMRRGETITRYTSEADKGWHDVLTKDAQVITRSSKKALPLIPQAEINVNPNMQQNPLY